MENLIPDANTDITMKRPPSRRETDDSENTMDLVSDLADAIENWQSFKSGRSLGVLSRQSGVSKSTLSRVVNGTTDSLDLENAISIALTVLDDDTASSLLQKHFPKVSQWMKVTSSKGQAISSEMNEYFLSADFLAILMLCDKLSGATENDIKDYSGRLGITKLRTLLSNNFIQQKGDRFFATNKILSMINPLTLTKMIQNFGLLFEEANAEKPRIAVKIGIFQALSLEGIDKAYDLTREYEKKMQNLVTDNSLHGDIPFFVGLLQNILNGDCT